MSCLDCCGWRHAATDSGTLLGCAICAPLVSLVCGLFFLFATDLFLCSAELFINFFSWGMNEFVLHVC